MALAAASNPKVPPEAQALYKQAADHAGVALGLDEALKRKGLPCVPVAG